MLQKQPPFWFKKKEEKHAIKPMTVQGYTRRTTTISSSTGKRIVLRAKCQWYSKMLRENIHHTTYLFVWIIQR